MSEDGPLLARLPATALATLADLRRERGLSVEVAGDRAWLLVEGPPESLLHRLMAISGVALFEARDGAWFPRGGRLPASEVTFDRQAARPLSRAVLPAPIEPVPPPEGRPAPAPLRLVRDARPRPATALLGPLRALGPWADSAPSAEIEGVSAAIRGDAVLLRGRPLPPIDGATRLWGRRVLCPLGWRPDPDLPEGALLAALGAGEDRLLLIVEGAYHLIPEAALAPLTRASARLAVDPMRGGPAR